MREFRNDRHIEIGSKNIGQEDMTLRFMLFVKCICEFGYNKIIIIPKSRILNKKFNKLN